MLPFIKIINGIEVMATLKDERTVKFSITKNGNEVPIFLGRLDGNEKFSECFIKYEKSLIKAVKSI